MILTGLVNNTRSKDMKVIRRSKRRSRPIIRDDHGIQEIAVKLEEARNLESLSSKAFYLDELERKPWEVSFDQRDNAVNTLRFLKFWFELPRSVYFLAVHFLDEFLVLMQVQQKYLACISVSCFYIAAEYFGFQVDETHLVGLTQSKCTVKDMQRMCSVIKQKLNIDNHKGFTTNLDFLSIFMDILETVSVQLGIRPLVKRVFKYESLATRLEILVGNSKCAFTKPSMLNLALIQWQMEAFSNQGISKKSLCSLREMFCLIGVLLELQCMCKINFSEIYNYNTKLWKIMEQYDAHDKSIHSQALKWRFSNSTLLMASKLKKHHQTLDIIEE